LIVLWVHRYSFRRKKIRLEKVLDNIDEIAKSLCFEGLSEENKHCAKLAVITLRALLEEYCSKPNPENLGDIDVAE
jgi:hypothetical protein